MDKASRGTQVGTPSTEDEKPTQGRIKPVNQSMTRTGELSKIIDKALPNQ